MIVTHVNNVLVNGSAKCISNPAQPQLIDVKKLLCFLSLCCQYEPPLRFPDNCLKPLVLQCFLGPTP